MSRRETGQVEAGTGAFSRQRPPARAVFRVEHDHIQVGEDGVPHPAGSLVHSVTARLWGEAGAPRLAVLYNLVPALRPAYGSFPRAVAAARVFRRQLCERVFALLAAAYPEVVNPSGIELAPIEFDLEGYHVNKKFMGGDIDFASNKQAHFDIVEPLGSNIYGPNLNIRGGWPVFADARAYCSDHGLTITDILGKVPGTRNLTLRSPHYQALVEDYSVAYELDMVNDTPFTVFLNRVREAGLLHGATAVEQQRQDTETRRPIGHYAWDNVTDAAADRWYRELRQTNDRVPGDTAGPKPLIPASIRLARGPLVIHIS